MEPAEIRLPRWHGIGFACNGSALRAAAAVAAAVFSAMVSGQNFPGSVIAAVPALAFLVLLYDSPRRPWTATQRIAAAAALGGCIAVFVTPDALNLAVTWAALGAFALSRKGHSITNLARTFGILASRALLSPIRLITDMRVLTLSSRRAAPTSPWPQWRYAVLPIAAGVVFLGLLRAANPVLNSLFRSWTLADLFNLLATWSPIVFCVTLAAIWSLFRLKSGSGLEPAQIAQPAPPWHTAYFAPAPVIVTLLFLNVLFLTQNLLDARYILSGATLPPGMTYAAYVNEGANTLVITVLLAACLMILALWPGSRTEQSLPVRALVYLWIAQNLVLTIFCIGRTLSYIDAYSMTLIRLTGLVWMGLIVVGLVLIAIRVIGRRTNLWLLNTNIAAAFAVLWASGFVDYRAIVADYNVAQVTGAPEYDLAIELSKLDIQYLRELGPSALPALDRLSDRLAAAPEPYRVHVAHALDTTNAIRTVLRIINATQQADWKTWTLRGHRLPGNPA